MIDLSGYRKYKLNENYFETIDTEEKAYWLGLIYADGCLHIRTNGVKTFCLALKEEDGYIIEELNSALDSEYKVKHNVNNWNTRYSRLDINSKLFCEHLENKGVHPNKTTECLFPTQEIVPINLRKHFIRGFMDGDGCISITHDTDYSLKFIGTYEMMKGIQDFFGIENGSLVQDKRCNVPIYSLGYHGNRITENLLTILYEDSHISLDRKYQRFLSLCQLNENNSLDSLYDSNIRRSNIFKLYKQGLSYLKICEVTGHSTSYINSVIKPYRDIEMAKLDEDILEMYSNGKSKLSICKITGRSRDYIRKLVG